MSASVQDFHSQIASIMEVLANAAVAEICKVVDDGYAVVNLEMSRSQKENEFLRRRIKVLELQISRYRVERLKSPAEGSFCSRYPGVRLLQHRQGRDTPTGSSLQNRNRFLNRAPQRTSPIILDQDPDQEVVTTTKAEPIESEEDSELVIVKVEGNTSINDTTPNLSVTIQAPHKEGQGFVKNPSSIQDAQDLGHEDGGYLKASPLEKDQSPILPVRPTHSPNPAQQLQLSCSTQTAQASLTLNQVSGNPTTSMSHRRNSQEGSASKYSHSQTSQFTPAILSIESGMACNVSQNNAMSQYKAMLPIQNYQVCSKLGSSVVEQPMEQTWAEGQKVMGSNNFSNQPDLTNQESKNQETILPFACTFCSLQFTHHSQLKKHKRVHLGEKPYPCVECGKMFGQVSSLRRHRLVHTGERPYPCPHCGKEFTTAGNLKVHQSVHTGERKFSCSTCGKNFSFLSNLIRHQAIHAKK